MTRRLTFVRSVAAVVLAAAAGVVVPAALTSPAEAAACTGETGVTVVVDYAEHGGVQVGCAKNAGGATASTAFKEAGFTLSYVDRGPGTGMVCKVAGVPSSASCVSAPPSDAYWALWVANDTSGSWSYSSRGVTQLKVSDGGYVAFAWHQGSGKAQAPNVKPVRSAPEKPEPTKKPTTKPSKKPGPKPADKTEPEADPTRRPTSAPPSALPTDSPSTEPAESEMPSESPTQETKKPKKSESASPSETASSDVPTVDEITEGPPEGGVVENSDDDGSDDGLPLWVPIIAVVVVAAAGGAVVVRRRLG